MQIKKALNKALSKIFRKEPLPKLSKSGYSALMTDKEAVKNITFLTIENMEVNNNA